MNETTQPDPRKTQPHDDPLSPDERTTVENMRRWTGDVIAPFTGDEMAVLLAIIDRLAPLAPPQPTPEGLPLDTGDVQRDLDLQDAMDLDIPDGDGGWKPDEPYDDTDEGRDANGDFDPTDVDTAPATPPAPEASRTPSYFDPDRVVDEAVTSDPPEAATPARLTTAQIVLLTRIADGERIYKNPFDYSHRGDDFRAVSSAMIDRLLRNKLVTHSYNQFKDRSFLALTDAGRAALAAAKGGAS